MALKYSRQREAIKEFVMSRKDHPTADDVYMGLRQEFPNLSLGTVYRNLTLLSDHGELLRLRLGDGADRFDAATYPHYHFICQECGSVEDLMSPIIDEINNQVGQGFEGQILSHSAQFYGKCTNCMSKSS